MELLYLVYADELGRQAFLATLPMKRVQILATQDFWFILVY